MGKMIFINLPVSDLVRSTALSRSKSRMTMDNSYFAFARHTECDSITTLQTAA